MQTFPRKNGYVDLAKRGLVVEGLQFTYCKEPEILEKEEKSRARMPGG